MLLVVGALTSLAGAYWLMNVDKTEANTLVTIAQPAKSEPVFETIVEIAIQPQLPQEVTKPAVAPPVEVKPEVKPQVNPQVTPPRTTTNGIAPDEKPVTPPSTDTATTPAALLTRGISTAASDPVKARTMLSSALLSGTLAPIDAKRASDALIDIGRTLVFTPVCNANDPLFFQYTIASGDSLERIVRRHKIGCDWRLVARINNIKKPESIRVGQRIKLPKGPFSAVVSKRDYRVDLCMGAGAERVVLTSMPCGLGSANGTPTGLFRVRAGSKLLDPEWTHPVTGEHFAASNPANPIGEHWLGLEGIDATNAQLAGYGMHGTVDVDSIGQDRSLGCVRLLSEDIGVLWESLGDNASVEIRAQ